MRYARLLLIAMLLVGGPVSTRAADSDLIAIDVLLLPDAPTAIRARAINAQLRTDYPDGFALDATHIPHITLLQTFVLTADLPAVERAVDAVFAGADLRRMQLRATGLFDGRVSSVGVTGITIAPTPALTKLQQDISAAVAPFARHGGTAAAFVDTPVSPTIGWTINYVGTFGENASGDNYAPHITTGIARPDYVDQLAAAPFAEFGFKLSGAAIYQLGDVGTARKPLWTAPR